MAHRYIRSACMVLVLVWGIAVSPADAETPLERVLQLHFQNLGGIQRLQRVKTVHMVGLANFRGNEGTTETWYKRPNRFRMQLEYQGMTLIQAYDGQQAWWVQPFGGSDEPEIMPAPQAERLRRQTQDLFSPFLNYKKKGYAVQYIGETQIDGRDVYHLRLRRQQLITDYYLDRQTALIYKAVTRMRQQQQTFVSETLMQDYRKVEGLVFPFQIRTLVNGETVYELNVTVIEVNIPIPDRWFAFPKQQGHQQP